LPIFGRVKKHATKYEMTMLIFDYIWACSGKYD